MNRIMTGVLVFSLLLSISGCGSSSDSEPAPTGIDDQVPADSGGNDQDPGTIDITDAIFVSRDGSCAAYANMYFSSVADVQRGIAFEGALTVTVSGGKCVFETNAIPNHDFNDGGRFATNVSSQNVRYEMTSSPEVASSVTELILGDNAIFLNGVKLDLLAAACYGVGREQLGREKIGCGQDEIDNPWRYDPMAPLNEFGTDNNNAHTQPDGTYHYHGNPMVMFENDCESTGASPSPVVGFAADGFPIYGTCIDDEGAVRQAQSSYVLKDNGGPRQTVAGYQSPSQGEGAIASSVATTSFRRGRAISMNATAWSWMVSMVITLSTRIHG